MPLTFGTAGVRAPMGPGPERMNAGTVALVATAVARHVRTQEPAGSTVIVGGDARHGSAGFVDVVAAVLTAHGLVVVVPGSPVPTPVIAAAVRSRGAVAGLMVTASHNPATDNGIKVYGPEGAQIVPPTDSHIEQHLRTAEREGVGVPETGATGARVDPTLIDDYVDSVVAGLPAPARPPRVALTPVHGVGGEICRRVLAGIGVDDVTLVPGQERPDPDFPTVESPNPERPATTLRLRGVAEEIGADVALALDPDADRCAVGYRAPDGRWRMLDGDDTGGLLADHLLTTPLPGSVRASGSRSGVPVVASTIVSSRLPSLLVPARGGRHVETLTGFKWLVRAADPLLYAYEEAIGHCVLPRVVADKDGISAAGAWCAMVGSAGRSVGAGLDALAEEFGAHLRHNVAHPLVPGADPDAALRRAAERLGSTGTVTPLDGTDGVRVSVPGARAVIRPSGTEPLLKSYVESWTTPRPSRSDREDAGRRLTALADRVAAAITS
ncbi:phosphomannomutase [Dietzia sp. UCD-THP]|uniref:phospho-sugar mutase n=1 Tax=Dietzia sp. UCD-THP TaxID=1292020 RepID=UPI0003718302|nr:phospho-sugar mutase [Dietzia sp. UCD-THP]EYT64158.1 phosphomannomutase [Dietzia sp. UCD-THP]